MRIERDGFPWIAGGVLLTVLAGSLGGWMVSVLPGALTLFVVSFFRDPERTTPRQPGLVVSPADGRVTEVVREKGRIRISIFLSVFNVHVNRAPEGGRIKDVVYRKGRFLMGFRPEASSQNERNDILLELENGDQIRFSQIAGWVARRIVCRVAAGDRLERGQRIGLIRFGSRMDVEVPESYGISVSRGVRVRAGETVLARRDG